MCIHPDCMYDPLTGGAFYEAACLGYDGHLDCVSDVVLEIIVAELSGELDDMGVGTAPDGPGGGEGAHEIENAVTVVAEDADGEELAEGGAGRRERAICEVVLVPDEVDPVQKKGEDNGFVPCALDGVVLVFEGADESVRNVGGCELLMDENGVENRAKRTASKVRGVSIWGWVTEKRRRKRNTDRYNAVVVSVGQRKQTRVRSRTIMSCGGSESNTDDVEVTDCSDNVDDGPHGHSAQKRLLFHADWPGPARRRADRHVLCSHDIPVPTARVRRVESRPTSSSSNSCTPSSHPQSKYTMPYTRLSRSSSSSSSPSNADPIQQVYECMVRGIAVMRRRGDSYVNATQILKVAGIEKGRRTKILEKEILPGKHEIVQGGYGKYQGTWCASTLAPSPLSHPLLRIPLDRGRDIAAQYGVAPLLGPLFDFTPSSSSLVSLPAANTAPSPRPISAASSFSNPAYPQSVLPAASMMPGSALRLLNQGRAQGLFTPSTSALAPSRSAIFPSSAYQAANSPSAPSPTSPPIQQSLKRARSDSEVVSAVQSLSHPHPSQLTLDALVNIGPSPTKRPRKEPSPQPDLSQSSALSSLPSQPQRATSVADAPFPHTARSPHPPFINGSSINGIDTDSPLRFSTKPPLVRDSSIFRDARRAQLVAAICRQDDLDPALALLRELTADPSLPLEVDAILDDKGHTALHLAASLGRQNIVEQLIAAGADIHRGNFAGETPLIRASIDTHNSDQQSFNVIVHALHQSIRTLDTSKKSVLHHIMYLAGIQGRASCARYYLDQIFIWIAQNQGGDFRSIVDLQDEHGDTALNIAARVGNRSLVRTLLDVGANRILPNKLGLRPGDFGVEVEVGVAV